MMNLAPRAVRYVVGGSLALCCALALISAAPTPQPRPPRPKPPPSRSDGRTWSETVNGVQTVNATGRLAVSARGSVKVQGSADSSIRYTLVKRVSASSEAEARVLFQQFQVRADHSGDLTILRFVHGGDDASSSELVLRVPRGLREVAVETHGGSVEAMDLAGSLKAETGGGRMALDRIGGRVVALTAGGDVTLGSIGGSILCTSAGGAISAKRLAGDAMIETAGGDIDVNEVVGALRASTAGGGIRITRAGSSVSAKTAGGTIDVREARGIVIANNQGGPIDIGASDGAILESAGGAIRLGAIAGNVRASTAVGNIHAYLALGRSIQAGALTTGAGDITVYIPADYPITIRAESTASNGARAIVSDFPGLTIRTSGPMAVAEGKIHGGGPLLRLNGMGGTISIKKRDTTTDE